MRRAREFHKGALRPLPRASPSQLGATGLAVAGVLAAVFTTANETLDGLPFVILVIVGALGAMLIVEAGHHTGRRLLALGVAGALVVTVAIALALAADVDAPAELTASNVPSAAVSSPRDGTDASAGADKRRPDRPALRLTIDQSPPDVYYVAFPDELQLPDERTGWAELIDQGGQDTRLSTFDVTLANRSDRPLTVRDISLEILGSDDPPTGSLAYQYTQGDSGLGEFAAHVEEDSEGARVDLHEVIDGVPGWRDDPVRKPFFEANYIALAPGEIYEATIGVETELPRSIEYRFVIEGSTPEAKFEVRDSRVRRISGLDDRNADHYAHYYVEGLLGFMKGTGLCPSLDVRRWYEVPKGESPGDCPADHQSPVAP